MVNLVSSPEIYTHEWASFSTRDFPENKKAKSGDKVRIIQTDTEDTRPVEDVVWTDEYYQLTFKKAGLESIATYRPLAKENESYAWINETKIAPWVIYVLKKQKKQVRDESLRSALTCKIYDFETSSLRKSVGD
jgi:hypothetical protein